MIRILNIIGSVDYGGAETFLINIYRKLDRTRIQFDFLVCEGKTENSYWDEIESLGGRIFLIPKKKENFIKNQLGIYKIVKQENYKIVWRHAYNMFKAMDLIPAKIGGARRTILHAHSTNAKRIEVMLGRLMAPLTNLCITDRFACGKSAGEYLYGNKPFIIVPNGIDVKKFLYKESVRENYRKKFGFNKQFVVGHVGRFTEAKNHSFLLEIFKEILYYENKSVLILVGTGPLEARIRNKIDELGIKQKVMFLGLRNDVENIMQMMDIFVMPSLWEGLPVSLIEMQASDLPCLVSDAVSKEGKVTENVKFMSLNKSAEEWAKQALEMKKAMRYSDICEQQIKKQGFDICDIARKLEEDFCGNDEYREID